MMTTQKQILGLVAWLIVCFIAAAIGSIASLNAENFYAQLVRPQWAPPGSVFGPVWSVLYALMAISAWLVWRIDGFGRTGSALLLFLVQLVVNALWSWLFFAWKLGAFSFAEIILLWVLILATVFVFWRVHKLAAVLLVPYLLWVSFASILNYSIWQLNPMLLG